MINLMRRGIEILRLMEIIVMISIRIVIINTFKSIKIKMIKWCYIILLNLQN